MKSTVNMHMNKGDVSELHNVRDEDLIVGENIKNKGVCALIRFILDFCIIFVSGLALVVMCYYFNFGEVRFFCFFGAFTGLILEKITVSRLIRFILSKILLLICTLLGIIWQPFVKILDILAKILLKIKNKFFKAIEKMFKTLYNIYVRKKLIKKSKKGFLKTLRK